MVDTGKLRRIGWLMVVSELLLLLFAGKWLSWQYNDAKKRLNIDVEDVFLKVKQQKIDSLLLTKLSPLFKDASGRDSLKFNINIDFTDSLNTLDIRDKTSMEGSDFSRITVQHRTGDSISPMITKGVRMFVVQAKQDLKQDFLIKLDSADFFQVFNHSLDSIGPILKSGWINTNLEKKEFQFGTDELNAESRIEVSNYRLFLIKKMLPEILFSAVLIILTGFAFYLAYFNLRGQMRIGIQKDNFISNMSHELKTPIATAKVALEALVNFNAIDDPRKRTDYLQMAAWEIDRLDALVTNVMNNVMLEGGKIVLQREEIEINSLIRHLLTGFQLRLEEKNIVTRFDSIAEIAMVTGDKTHLQGVFYNLLDNAIKYGGNMLWISVKTDHTQKVVVSVADNGPGIPKEYKDKIFEKFFRVPYGNRHDVKGYGLGLSYTKYVVEAHKGTIGYERDSNDRTLFIVKLPVKAS